MPPYIVVVEDDHLQEGPLEEYLIDRFPGSQVETIRFESDFRDRLEHYREARPDLVIMDVMLKWARSREDAPAEPPDVAEGQYFRAGMRCTRLMAADENLRDVPVIVYTILERQDLERDDPDWLSTCDYVRKSSDLEVIGRRVRRLLRDGRGRSQTFSPA